MTWKSFMVKMFLKKVMLSPNLCVLDQCFPPVEYCCFKLFREKGTEIDSQYPHANVYFYSFIC